MTADLRCGHALDVLAALPAGVARTCVTSPPYWGLRDYGLEPVDWPAVSFAPMAGLPPVAVPAWRGCLGLEPDPWAFVGHLVAVFREVRRVLAEDGALWLNLGDCWASGPPGGRDPERWPAQSRNRGSRGDSPKHVEGSALCEQPNRRALPGLKPKDLLGIPWRVAFALQADGWWLRSEVVWNKVNGMPESVRDRPTKAHEQVFLLTKSERYFYDTDAIAERAVRGFAGSRFDAGKTAEHQLGRASSAPRAERETRNRRSVWTIAGEPYSGPHFAVMPSALARLCVRAGSAPGDAVLDPFSGAGTTGLAALQEGRNFVGAEASADYCRLARERWDAEGRQVVALPAGERPAPPEQASLLELSEARPH